ncbi:diguanylate cyclase [Aliagarivorans taiwanensis]|uniref:diguanylate cyclase n=1 Tax=Aliagarivorans taiwanensis TaxID=561966 RepID=UPI00042918B3|nr:diguanylate cyclase [Aliagarivorans taiwanensis]
MLQVLIVDDSATVLKIIRHVSGRLTHLKPVFASSFEQAKQLYLSAPDQYFAALSDYSLPDSPNGELIDFLLEQGLPTVVLSGSFNEKNQGELILKGVVDYVLKEGRYSYELAMDLLNQLYQNRNVKVLVAEDSRSARKYIVGQLNRHLYQVIEAENGAIALQALRDDPEIKLLITDYQMPEMDGYQLVQTIRHEMATRRLSILGLSSADNVIVSSKFIKNGADDFLHKPFSVEEFQCRVSHNLNTLSMLEELEKAAYQDYLTEIPNRRFFIERARELYEQAESKQTQLAVAVMDIDKFKLFNDQHGHEAGDAVLKHFAQILKRCLGKFVFGRTGGEEFSVAMAGLSNDQAYQLLDAFRNQIADSHCDYNGQQLTITVSIGVTNDLSEHLEGQLHHADELLYNAKEAGRNLVVGD